MYINNQQFYNSNGVYAHEPYISNNLKGAIIECKWVWQCECYDFEEFFHDIKTLLSGPFFTRRMEMFTRPNGFMLYGKLGVGFFSTSDFLYPNMKIRRRLIRARPNFYMISDNPYVSLGTVDCSLYARRIALNDDYHKKWTCLHILMGISNIYNIDSSKHFHHSCQTKPVHPRKHFSQGSSSLDCYRNEYKLCIHWLVHWKPFLVSTFWSQTN